MLKCHKSPKNARSRAPRPMICSFFDIFHLLIGILVQNYIYSESSYPIQALLLYFDGCYLGVKVGVDGCYFTKEHIHFAHYQIYSKI